MPLRSRRAFLRFALLFVLPAVALVAAVTMGQEHPLRLTENAYIKAHHLAIVPISTVARRVLRKTTA